MKNKVCTSFLSGLVLVFLSTSAFAADLTLQCDGVIRRLGGSYVRNISVQLDLFWKSSTYRLFTFKDGVRVRIGGGGLELRQNLIALNNGTWIIDRKSGTMNLSKANGIDPDLENLSCKRAGNNDNMF